MKKTLIAVILLIFGIMALGVLALSPMPEAFKFKEEAEGIVFYSNVMPPIDYLHKLKERYYFIVSPAMKEEGSNINQLMAQALSLSNVSLVANKRFSIALVRVFDSENELSYCQTNWGNERLNERISLQDCQRALTYLDSNVLMEINLPDNTLPKPKVVLKEAQILIYPKTSNDIVNVPFTILKSIYPNTEKALQKVNEMTEKLAS